MCLYIHLNEIELLTVGKRGPGKHNLPGARDTSHRMTIDTHFTHQSQVSHLIWRISKVEVSKLIRSFCTVSLLLLHLIRPLNP